jgi:hypothetical protein
MMRWLREIGLSVGDQRKMMETVGFACAEGEGRCSPGHRWNLRPTWGFLGWGFGVWKVCGLLLPPLPPCGASPGKIMSSALGT